MKCVILAAGLGKRLDPLTREMPKPMMLVANIPILEHAFQAVKAAGIQDILVNLFYLPEQITSYFGDGSQFGVQITWRREQVLSGPAGALLVFEDLLRTEESVLVVSGDALHDIDLQAFITAHRNAGVQLSVVMKEIQDPGRYGVGKIGADGLLREFVEKPALGRNAYGLVSCGIYCINPQLFSLFRRAGLYDFGADLIPDMIAQGKPVLGFKTSAYWADIGTPEVLRDANLDAIAGKVHLTLPGTFLSEDGIRMEHEAVIGENVHISGPLLIGSQVRIASDTTIIGPAIIGARCSIGQSVYLSRSVLLPDTIIPDHTVIIGGLLAPYAFTL